MRSSYNLLFIYAVIEVWGYLDILFQTSNGVFGFRNGMEMGMKRTKKKCNGMLIH